LSWATSAGSGTVYSWTVVYRPATPVFEVPYAPAIVDVREGFQVITNLVGVAPEDITVALPVIVRFCEVEPGFWLPYFAPAQTNPGPVPDHPEHHRVAPNE
jgi:uncharacterized OB-fold protein